MAEDVGQGFLEVGALEDAHVVAGIELLMRLAAHPVRTPDVLHLAIARDAQADVIATADRVVAAAAEAIGFDVARFD